MMPLNFLTFFIGLVTLLFRSSECIKGGKIAAAEEFPHHVALFHEGEYLCGGSIITPSIILSAAHCFQNETACEMVIAAGVLDISENADVSTLQTRRATDVIIHEYYDNDELYNDLAIVVLDYPFHFNEAVQSILLPWENETDFVNSSVTIVGFGETQLDSTSFEHLQKVKVPMIPQTTCQTLMDSELEWEYEIDDSQFCAGVKEIGACYGDSGGPAICTRSGDNASVICGIASLGNQCGNGTGLTVYTNVVYYIEWIDTIVKNITSGKIFYEDEATREKFTCEYKYWEWDWEKFFKGSLFGLIIYVIYVASRQVYRLIRKVALFSSLVLN